MCKAKYNQNLYMGWEALPPYDNSNKQYADWVTEIKKKA
jgi:hypothetical protein